MDYVTFLDKETYKQLAAGEIVLTGEHYNCTVNAYSVGVIQPCDNIRDQVILLLSYMAHADCTVCLRFKCDNPLKTFDVFDVNNSEGYYKLAPPHCSLAVVDHISYDMICKIFTQDDVVSFHELIKYHFDEVMFMLGYQQASERVCVCWPTVEKVWNDMEKTKVLSAYHWATIRDAVEEVHSHE